MNSKDIVKFSSIIIVSACVGFIIATSSLFRFPQASNREPWNQDMVKQFFKVHCFSLYSGIGDGLELYKNSDECQKLISKHESKLLEYFKVHEKELDFFFVDMSKMMRPAIIGYIEGLKSYLESPQLTLDIVSGGEKKKRAQKAREQYYSAKKELEHGISPHKVYARLVFYLVKAADDGANIIEINPAQMFKAGMKHHKMLRNGSDKAP